MFDNRESRYYIAIKISFCEGTMLNYTGPEDIVLKDRIRDYNSARKTLDDMVLVNKNKLYLTVLGHSIAHLQSILSGFSTYNETVKNWFLVNFLELLKNEADSLKYAAYADELRRCC